MGILKNMLKFFSSAIECPDKFADELLYIAPLRRNFIKIGATLLVRKNFIAIIAVKGKVTDVFIQGKHKLFLGAMPLTARVVNFKTKKKGDKKKEKFKGEIYFVNLDNFTQEFIGVEPFIIKDEKLGKAKVRANGQFAFNIINAKTFIEVCLINWAYLKADTVKKQLSVWVSAQVIKALQYLNLPLFEFAKNSQYIAERISPNITKKFLSYGMEINDLKITETFIPNKFAVMLSEMEDENSKSSLKNDYIKGTAYIPINNENKSITKNHYYDDDEEYDQMSSSDEFYDFNNIVQQLPVYNEYKPSNEHVLIDEDMDYLNKNIKTCINCGASIAKDAFACYNCGVKQTQKRVCPNCNAEIKEGEFVCPNCRSIII